MAPGTQTAVAAAAAAAAAAATTGTGGLAVDPYSAWSKVDPMAAVYNYTPSNNAVNASGTAATASLLTDTNVAAAAGTAALADPRDVSAYTPPWSDVARPGGGGAGGVGSSSSTFSILNSATAPTSLTAAADTKNLELDVFARQNGTQVINYSHHVCQK